MFLVVPGFNEETRWNHAYWLDLVAQTPCGLMFVDDGSTDGTPRQMSRTAQSTGASTLILEANVGKGEAVRRGMLHVLEQHEPSVVGFMDADAAFAVAEPGRLLTKLLELHCRDQSVRTVWGSRPRLSGRQISRSPMRHYLGRLLATRLFAGVEDAPYDSQCGLKLFIVDDELQTMLSEPFVTRWLFDVELFARARRSDYRIWEEPVLEWRETAGSKVTLREAARIFRESHVVRKLLLKSP